MSFFDSRRPQPQARGTTLLCGVACLVLCACTDGKGSPIIAIDAVDGAVFGSAVAGTSAQADAGSRDDEQPEQPATQTADCKRTDSMWPTMYASDERKLIDRINQIRANPSTLCPPSPSFGPLQALESDRALQCSARLRLANEQGPRGPGNGPSYYATNPRSPDQGMLHDRERTANSRIDAEVIFSNVNSVDGIIQILKSDPDDAGSFCFIAVNPFLSVVGAARWESVWVLDFSYSATTGAPRPPGMGNAGSGNSGTGGR
jgi:hypothetical protein